MFPDVNKRKMVLLHNGETVDRLISLAVESDILDVRYNCAGTIGQLVLTGNDNTHISVPLITYNSNPQ